MLVLAICLLGCGENESPSLKEQISEKMTGYEKKGFSGTLLAVHRGELLIREGYGFANKLEGIRNAPNTIFDFGSLTKQFTGAAIVKAEALGLLTVEQKLIDFFPQVPDDKATITLHQLLTHSSGFKSTLGDDYDLVTKDEFLDLAFQSTLVFTPGTAYEYSNVGYSLLGIILEKVSGQSYESFLKTYLFTPSGMEDTGYSLLQADSFKDRIAVGYRKGEPDGKPTEKPWLADGPGWHLKANGGILTTADDMYSWINALTGKKVLDDKALAKYLTPYVQEGEESSYYCYGWVADESDLGRVFWHDGGNDIFSAIVSFFPDTETVIIMASNDSTIDAFDVADELMELVAEYRY